MRSNYDLMAAVGVTAKAEVMASRPLTPSELGTSLMIILLREGRRPIPTALTRTYRFAIKGEHDEGLLGRQCNCAWPLRMYVIPVEKQYCVCVRDIEHDLRGASTREPRKIQRIEWKRNSFGSLSTPRKHYGAESDFSDVQASLYVPEPCGTRGRCWTSAAME